MTVFQGAILAVGLVAIVEGYILIGRAQLFLTAAEQILAALQVPLRAVPSKSARRTVAPADIRPRAWFQTLRRLGDLRDHLSAVFEPVLLEEEPEDVVEDLVDDDVELARWADDGGLIPPAPVKAALTADRLPADLVDTERETPLDEDQAATDTFPRVPATEPVERIEIVGGLRLPPEGFEPELPVDDDAPRIVDEVDLQLVRFGLRTAEGHRP
jgi:hypothetical protein